MQQIRKIRKYLREVGKHRELYKNKNLRYCKDTWIFYWRFLAFLENTGKRPRTIEDYYFKIYHFLIFLNNIPLRKVKQKNVEDYLLYLKYEKNIIPYQLKNYRNCIAGFFSFVMRYTSKPKKNPASNLKIRTHYPQIERMDVFSKEEIHLIIKKPLFELIKINRMDFKTDHDFNIKKYTILMHYLILKLLFSTGIRPFELISIELSDINWDDLKIRIKNKGTQQYIIEDRNIFITKNYTEDLYKYLKIAESKRTVGAENKLFIHYNGTKLGNNYPNKITKYWAERCGISRRVYAYMASYSYCTILVESGADIYSLKKLMGHKQLQITLKHYLKLSSREIRKEWQLYNPLIKERV